MTIDLATMTDEALIAETKRAAELERRSTAELLALLIEVERRALHLTLGYSSMFLYSRRALLLSEQAAFKRITAARAARRYPIILKGLAEGELTLSSIRVLAPHLMDENVDGLLEAARHKSTREVEQLIAATISQPDIPASVRALPVPKVEDPTSQTEARALLDCEADETPANQAIGHPAAPATARKATVAPIASRRYLLKVTVGQETHDKLQRTRALLRHVVPDGDLAEILDRALTLLLREAERTKCGESGFVEFHHVVPFSAGGKTDEGNLELRCRAHNQHEGAVVRAASTRRAASA